jgi:hypothetical protein
MTRKISDEPAYRLGKLSAVVDYSVISLRILLELIAEEKKQSNRDAHVRTCQSIIEKLERTLNEVITKDEELT